MYFYIKAHCLSCECRFVTTRDTTVVVRVHSAEICDASSHQLRVLFWITYHFSNHDGCSYLCLQRTVTPYGQATIVVRILKPH